MNTQDENSPYIEDTPKVSLKEETLNFLQTGFSKYLPVVFENRLTNYIFWSSMGLFLNYGESLLKVIEEEEEEKKNE